MTVKRSTGMILFDCHCERSFGKPFPKIGDVLWCHKHNREVTVIRNPYSGGNYAYSCSCGTGRTFGADKRRAESRAAVHHQRNPDHTTSLTNGGKVYHRFKPSDYL